MTDITELAQREKFEAWAEQACAAPWGYLKKRRTTEGYSEQIYTCMWTAWKEAGAEMVEALEKAQQTEKTLESRNRRLDGIITAAEKRIAELEPIRAAAEKLVRCKGRYHSEPVCFVSERNLATLTKYRAAVKVKAEPVMVRPVALYRHAQPAQVVMDEAQSRAAFEQWCTVNIDRNKWHPEFYAHLPAREQWAAWEACRAAMLNGGKS